jgi:hypothetical protein
MKKLPELMRLPAKKEVTISEEILPSDSPFYSYRKAAFLRGAADPLCCENCGCTMELVQTVPPTTKPKPALPFQIWRVRQAVFANTS